MRLIPGKTKVKVELFKGVSVSDVIIALVAAVMAGFVITSSLPGKLYIVIGIVCIAAMLLLRLDTEPNYIYILHIFRHLGYKRSFMRAHTDAELENREADEGEQEEPLESTAQRKARLKAEREERKADDKKLKDRSVSKEEKDAIWLKRANQSAAKKQLKKQGKGVKAFDMKELVSFTGISDGYIEFGGEYYGTAIEIKPVEFRFFSPTRRNNSIENGVGRVLRSLASDYGANIIKIERPINYEAYLENENKKVSDLRASYESGMITEEEFKTRVDVLCDRINDLRDICYDNKVIQPFYYLVLFDSDKHQLDIAADAALDTLLSGEVEGRRLDSRELALFLKYSNYLDFEENNIDSVDPENYAEWAMPKNVGIQHNSVNINGIVTYNFRIVNYPSLVDDAWLASVMSMPATKVIVKCKPMDRDKAVRGIDRSLQELRGQFMATGVDSRRIELQEHIDTLSTLLATLRGDNETLLEVNVYVTAYDIIASGNADEKKSSLPHYNNMKRVVRRLYSENNLRLNNMDFDQVNGFIASQVSAFDPLAAKGRGIPSNSVAASYPWIFAHVADKNGIKLGTAEGCPVFIDFFRRDSERVNSNMVIVGKSGSGKSYATKSLLTNLAADDAKIFILDPENEYSELAANLHGKFINVGNAQYGRLNPFHIITSLGDDENDGSGAAGSYATHLQFLEEFFRQILPDCDKDAMEYLNSIIDRMYTNMNITADTDLSKLKPEDYPIFDDLYDAILTEFQSTDNDYIRTMLRTLMNYISKFSGGGRNASIWNGASSVTTDENFTVFNFQSLLANRNGSIANAQMLLVLKYIDNEIIKNREYNIKYGLNRKVVVVIDEAHVFIDTKYPVALDFMFQLAKRIRKYNGMQIVITQNIKDFVGSEEIARKSTAIINACQYSFIFSLAPNDMDDLCKLYEKAGGINETEQEQIVSAPRGQAFAVMSPQSRTTFKIEVPKDVISIFKNPNYVSTYFGGENGDAEWEKFIGDSRDLRSENVSENTVAEDTGVTLERAKSRVTFVELSEDEYGEIEAQRLAEEKEKAEIEAQRLAEEKEKAEIEEAIAAAKAAEAAARKSVMFEEVTEPVSEEIPEPSYQATEAPVYRAPAAEAPVIPNVVVQAAPASEKTEQLLSELLGKFSYDAMVQEIRRSVREELEKELENKHFAAAPAEEIKDDSLGSIFNEDALNTLLEENMALDTEETGTDGVIDELLGAGEPVAAEEETVNEEFENYLLEDTDSEETFDIMQMLLTEAENIQDMSPIDMMIEYDEKVLEIKLEELVQYNAKH